MHAIELQAGKGGAAGAQRGPAAQLMAKEGNYATLRLPSGEFRMVHVGVPGDGRTGRQRRARKHRHRQGRAAAAGWAGRPHQRGVVMNPVDHPHGGGEGKAPIGHASSGDAVGQADAWISDAQEEQEV